MGKTVVLGLVTTKLGEPENMDDIAVEAQRYTLRLVVEAAAEVWS